MTTPALENLIRACQQASQLEVFRETDERVHVSATLSAVAGIYEVLRNYMEFKEEHVLRQSAIARILRRMTMLRIRQEGAGRGGNILRELVRGGYFPNDAIPESRAADIDAILARYDAVFQETGILQEQVRNDLSGLASVEIEHLLVPKEKLVEEAFVLFVYETVRDRILWQGALASPGHEAQLFIAAHRAVLRSDPHTIRWTLFRSAFPRWQELAPYEIRSQTAEILRILSAIAEHLRHPLGKHYLRAVRPYVPAFTILHDLVVTKTDAFPLIAQNSDIFTKEAEKAAQARTNAVQERLTTMATRATVYVFLTKMAVAFLFEVPAELFLKVFRHTPFFINLAFPPLLMFMAAKSAYVPRGKNIKKIVSTANAFIFTAGHAVPMDEVYLYHAGHRIRTSIFFLFTAVFFLFLAWVAIGFLRRLEFSIFSTAVFFFFLCVVSFFAWRIRQPVRDLTAIAPQEDFTATVIDLVAFPLLLVGRWISEGLAKINIPLIIFDIAIEAPLKTILNFIDDWLMFLRRKREELLE